VNYCSASLPNAGSGNPCESQTTLQNLYVYAVQGGVIYVVVKRQDAVQLLWLTTYASNYELAIRKPGDAATNPTDTGELVQDHFVLLPLGDGAKHSPPVVPNRRPMMRYTA